MDWIKTCYTFHSRIKISLTFCHVYIYIRFNKNLDEKAYVSAKTEAVKHLHTFILLDYFDFILKKAYCSYWNANSITF